MIDIHNHILPGIDDGADNLEASLAMARMAVQDGIRHIIATPHLLMCGLSWTEIQARTKQLNQVLVQAGIELTVHPGAEIPVSALDDEQYRVGLCGTEYLLVEFPLSGMLPSTPGLFEHITGLGYKIIIAHPERDPEAMRDPNLLLDLLSPDVTIQLTAGGLTGEMGKEIMSMSRYLLKKGAVTYIASDAHDTRNRRPELTPGLKAAQKHLRHGQVMRMVGDLPRMIIGPSAS
jgi:protein-tyrosine phosphatase